MADLEKEKAIAVLRSMIDNPDSCLDTKYSKSHEKVAVIYKDHVIELIGGDHKAIKYLDLKVEISKKEYKELYDHFMEVINKRKEEVTLRKFNELGQDFDE